jgi:hypothetical protein
MQKQSRKSAMMWIQRFIKPARTPHVHSPEQHGAPTPDDAVRHHLLSLPGDTWDIQIQHVGLVRKDNLFVYGGEWRQPPTHATILLGYALVEHQRSGWWVRHTTGNAYAATPPLLTAHVKLPGTVLVYGYIPTPTATTVEVVLNTGQTVCATITTHLFGLLVSHARSVRNVRVI